VKHYLGLGGLCLGAAAMVVAPEVAWANPTEVTSIEVRQTQSGMMLMMDTASGDRPQIFLVRRGESIVADLINTKLSLPQGQGGYSQNNPAAGIASIVVTPLDSNSTRVIVTGMGTPPNGEIVQDAPRGIVLNYSAALGTATPSQAAAPPPGITTPPQARSTPPQAQSTIAQTPNQPRPDVLVPNPQITIDGVPMEGAAPPVNPAPPFLPRAVAPPVGDISISSLDTSPYTINLGTAERVPRLVLRDAPVEEVLALLARAAGLNLVYLGDGGGEDSQANLEAGLPRTISLDVENESVQDVFNNVLRMSGLEANRENNTIVVGSRLPDSVRAVISRTLRLNQLTLVDARNFLLSQGAESSDVATQQQTQIVRLDPQDPNSPRLSTTTTRTTVELLAIADRDDPYIGYAPLPLQGLLVAIGNRAGSPLFSGNEITLVGDPRKVEMATRMLMQLETRRRQVAVNVKIVDVTLSNQDIFNSSFSFQVGDTFVSSDGGAAIVNLGGTRPPSAEQINLSPVTPPVVPLPDSISDNDAFLLPERPPIGPTGNFEFLQPGITQATADQVTFSLPTLFAFPTRFLANLEAQVQNGNAKILTDPTLVIQEGETANVNLTSQVIQKVEIDFVDTPSGERESRSVTLRDVGLELTVIVNRIDDNGFVTLQVSPSISAPVDQEEIGDDQFVTLVQERSVSSGRIRLRDGQTLILSGIIQDNDRTTVTKVPILGDIPILGALFRSTNRTNERQEVIVLLTPNILDDSDPANFGYTYTPGRDAREVLEQQGNFTFPQPQNP